MPDVEDMEPPDLSGVTPERRDEVRRRIAAIEEYDAMEERSWQNLARLCESVGLSPATFNRLWRSWRVLRDPTALQGIGPTGRRGNRLTDADDVRNLLADIPAGRTIERDVLDVERLAAERSVAVRSRSALRRLVRSIRAESLPPPSVGWSTTVVAVETVALEMTVEHDGGFILPVATLVFHPASGRILEARLSVLPASPASTAAALVRWLRRQTEHADATTVKGVAIDSDRRAGWEALFGILERHGVARSGRRDRTLLAGPMVAAAFGVQVLGIGVRPRMTHRPPSDRRPLVRTMRLNAPLTLDEAQRAVDERVRKQNPPLLQVRRAHCIVHDLESLVSALG